MRFYSKLKGKSSGGDFKYTPKLSDSHYNET